MPLFLVIPSSACPDLCLCLYSELKVGDPKDDVFMGPLVSRDHMSKVLNVVEEARKSGATIHTREAVLRQELPPSCQAVSLIFLFADHFFFKFRCYLKNLKQEWLLAF